MTTAMRASRAGALPAAISGISIDTRTLKPGEAFFAIKGDSRDGHDFVPAALKAGAGLAVVSAERAGDFARRCALLIVPDVLDGLRDLAHAARARAQAKIIAVTGSVGKTSTKEALLLALSKDGETHASAASYNNHWGVPLSLARCPETARYAVFEVGMNHAGEIAPLTKLLRPHVAVITTIEPVHLEYLGSIEAIADAKAEIFLGLEPGGAAVINRDNPQFARLARAAKAAGVERVISFGEHAKADARLIKCALQPDSSTVQARILGADVTYKLGAPGSISCSTRWRCSRRRSLPAPISRSRPSRSPGSSPRPGAVLACTLDMPGGTALLIDESYNANPASMRAAIALLGQAGVGPRGRRIAVLGDMLELGPQGAELHAALAEAIDGNAVDLVYCSWSADACPLAGPSHEPPGRLCRNGGAARTAGFGRRPAGRHAHDQRFERVPHGSDRQGAGKPLSPRQRSRLRRADASCSIGSRHSRTPSALSTCSATSRSAPAER